MKITIILLIVALNIGAQTFNHASEAEDEQPNQQEVFLKAIEELERVREYAKGGWTMFNHDGLIFLYNKNTGVVYKWWFKSSSEGGPNYGFDQVPMTHRPNNRPKPY